MSIHDPIDLNVRSQAIFDFIDRFFHLSCDFFSISDEDSALLSESASFKHSTLYPSYVIPKSLSSTSLGFNNYNFDITLFSSGNLFFYLPYKTRYIEFVVKRKRFILTIYDKLLNFPFDYFCLEKDVFIYEDKLGCDLDVIHVLDYFKNKEFIDVMNEDEWLIIWLLAKGYTSEKLSFIFSISKNAVDQSIKRILYKHKIYNRDLLVKVVQILGWDFFIPKKIIDSGFM
ncbi:hypothetical protein OKT76_17555 [Providencia rettgeri]|uniref:helix-turn-helix transcriptional regulator n=1 Tax=Providencia TaxID=586 RepID=UPI0018C64FA9|nr:MULTISPECIES: hypothetical protein [Providencia]MBG5925283.1 hypothetical protein [Providencia rettgeri]MCX9097533.1 hypothetical protein [Providencia rettgeri]HCT9039570.1 hypothetical protein [Providencia rettgeri]HEM7189379.1 hypothetical protein [Providencia rettgeri]HEM8213012.1 hypothetical protein [Providencia rettgeri]